MKTNLVTLFAVLAMFSASLVACGEKENNGEGEGEGESLVGGFNSIGASNSLFSVAPGKQVRFSRSNLRYNPFLNVWGFADNQYDYVGKDNEKIAADYNGWIDLFGWGTSGWNGGAVAYQPWATDAVDTHYWVGGNWTNGLFGPGADGDWGVYNAVANGGNVTGMWRTLKIDEWKYLLDSNEVRAGKWGLGQIGKDSYGLVILPDEWKQPDGVTFSPSDGTSGEGSPLNTYSYDQWNKMESAGAVFLPSASLRTELQVSDDFSGNHRGTYWMASYYYRTTAYTLTFDTWYLNESEGDVTLRTDMTRPRHVGCSVRLVQDQKN